MHRARPATCGKLAVRPAPPARGAKPRRLYVAIPGVLMRRARPSNSLGAAGTPVAPTACVTCGKLARVGRRRHVALPNRDC